jgi:hypothetical protein
MRFRAVLTAVIVTASLISLITGTRCPAAVFPSAPQVWTGYYQSSMMLGTHVEVRLDVTAMDGRTAQGLVTWNGAPFGPFRGMMDSTGGLKFMVESAGGTVPGEVLQFAGRLSELGDGSALMQGMFKIFRKAGGETPMDSGPAMMLRSFRWHSDSGPAFGGMFSNLACDSGNPVFLVPAVSYSNQIGANFRGSFTLPQLDVPIVEKPAPRFLDMVGTVGDMTSPDARDEDGVDFQFHAIGVLSQPGSPFPPGPCKNPFYLLDGHFAMSSHMVETSCTMESPGADSVLIALLFLRRVAP